ncbi:hypothetical protein V9K67_14850 [Paraflavisolibacter sp. H34]|uniref:hypothetical protein n=1 Tax=Huijunlia imazamoxiresistens TaxID=3127457 RepID=UPI00301B2DC6
MTTRSLMAVVTAIALWAVPPHFALRKKPGPQKVQKPQPRGHQKKQDFELVPGGLFL